MFFTRRSKFLENPKISSLKSEQPGRRASAHEVHVYITSLRKGKAP
jgi:hypothetical protein